MSDEQDMDFDPAALALALAQLRAEGEHEAADALLEAAQGVTVAKAADDADPHLAVAEAMLAHAEEAMAAGEDHLPGIEALRELLDDPAEFERVLGGTVGKAFDSDKHPRDDHGRFVSKDAIAEAKGDPKKEAELRKRVTDPEQRKKLDAALGGETDLGRTKRGQARHEAGQRRQTRDEAKQKTRKIIAHLRKVADLKAKLTADHLYELADHLGSEHVTIEDVRALRAALPGTGRMRWGGRRKDEMVASLREHARGRGFESRVKELGLDADEMRGALGAKPAAEGLPVTDVPLADHEGRVRDWIRTWMRDPAEKAKVDGIRADIRAGKQIAPAIFKDYGGGDLELLDGSHRAAALLLEGKTHVPAHVITKDTEHLLPPEQIERWRGRRGGSPPAEAVPAAPPATPGFDPAKTEAVRAHTDAAAKSWTSAEKSALQDYVLDVSLDLNRDLRAGKEPSDRDLRDIVKNLDSAMAKTPPLPEPVETHRGVRFATPEERDAFLAKLTPGSEYPDAGYHSSSLDPEQATKFLRGGEATGVVFRIAARHGIGVEGQATGGDAAAEREFVMPRGSKFRVASVEHGSPTVVRVEQLPQS